MITGVHNYVGNESTCQRILSLDGTRTIYCRLFRDNLIHRMACFHCGQHLDTNRGDGEEVCRFCFPIYQMAKPSKQCLACLTGSWHRA